MDVSTEKLNLNCQVQDFEHVYVKQERQLTPTSTFVIAKNEDKVKYIILLHWCIPPFFKDIACFI
jgi:hypothetical protein